MEQSIHAFPLDGSPSTITAINSHVLSIKSSNLSQGFFSPDQLVRAFNNIKKSGVPSRFLFFCKDAWVDFAQKVFGELKAGFLAGKTVLELTVDRKVYLFDFIRMFRFYSDTGRKNSIAWIDVHGRCFFPKNSIDDSVDSSQEKHLLMSSPFHHSTAKKKAEIYDEGMEVSSDRWPGAKMLRDDEKFYKVVEKLFLSGIKRFITNTVITSIHRCSHSTLAGNSRLLSFKLQKRATSEVRGNANVKFGWYGTLTSSSIDGIVSYGFSQPNSDQLGLVAHGIGIHLSPPHSPYESALLSQADEDGERHMVLCRVIMGNSEMVEAGSTRDQPSKEGFDSGVDDLVNPKWYVVWRTHMKTHIIPEYIVSFKCSNHSQGLKKKPTGVQKSSSVMNLSFWRLFAEIEKSLPSSKIRTLEMLFNQYKVGKINKEVFIRYMRSIAGDKLLISTINSLGAD